MEMFLMLVVMSLLGAAVAAALFAAATHDDRVSTSRPVVQPALAPQHFFASAPDLASAPEPARNRTEPDLEALRLRIEQHIRLEQAAAESFLHSPTGQSLQSRTHSPLLH